MNHVNIVPVHKIAQCDILVPPVAHRTSLACSTILGRIIVMHALLIVAAIFCIAWLSEAGRSRNRTKSSSHGLGSRTYFQKYFSTDVRLPTASPTAAPVTPIVKPNYETKLIEKAIEDYKYAKSTRTKPLKPLLCGTFIRASTAASTIISNVLLMKHSCDWVIVIYDGSVEFENKICQPLLKQANVVHCKRAEFPISNKPRVIPVYTLTDVIKSTQTNNNINTNSKGLTSVSATGTSSSKVVLAEPIGSVAKTVLYHDLLPYLPSYQRVFLLDEDISLMGFNVSLAMSIWDCAFKTPPLVVQPLVYEKTQFFPFVHKSMWRKKLRDVYASAVGIIEQQVSKANFYV